MVYTRAFRRLYIPRKQEPITAPDEKAGDKWDISWFTTRERCISILHHVIQSAEHFLSSPNHAANDMQLIPIEKIVSNRDSIRKAREAFLIQKGRTIDPNGLNIREETY